MSLLNQVLQDLDERAAPPAGQPIKLAAASSSSDAWDTGDRRHRGDGRGWLRHVAGSLVAVVGVAVLAWYAMNRPNGTVMPEEKAWVSVDTPVKQPSPEQASLPRQAVPQAAVDPELPMQEPARLHEQPGDIIEAAALPAPTAVPSPSVERSGLAHAVADVASVLPDRAEPDYVPLRNSQLPSEPPVIGRPTPRAARQPSIPVKVRTVKPGATRPLDSAHQLLRAGELAAAEQELLRLLAARPDDRQARELLVGLMVRGGRHAEADRQLDLGIRHHPGHAKFVLIKARLLVEAGDSAQALALLENAPVNPNGKVESLQMLGALYQQQGRYTEAVEAYRRLLRVTPAAGAAWVGLAISLDGLDDPRALDTYRRALQQDGLPSAARRYAEQRKTSLEAGNG